MRLEPHDPDESEEASIVLCRALGTEPSPHLAVTAAEDGRTDAVAHALRGAQG